jgi:hypothetical protein
MIFQMELTVKLNNSPKTASVVFAGRDDIGFVNEWRKTLGEVQNPFSRDSVDFAQLAVYRFTAHFGIELYASSIDDIGDHIQNNPNSEIASFVLLKCDWFPDSKVIGCAHFRRTWTNNFILDYLAAHPFIAKAPPKYAYEVRGAGTALLYFVSQIAKRYDSGKIWGEATQLSCKFYKKALKLEPVGDLIIAPREKYLEFANGFEIYLAGQSNALTVKSAELDEIYDTEITNPPFVGSKTAVFNPARRLAYRFLDLPDHVQTDIARRLQLMQNDDEDQPIAEQFRRFFKRATANGKLPNLWQEVEKLYPDGEPDKNPFPSP